MGPSWPRSLVLLDHCHRRRWPYPAVRDRCQARGYRQSPTRGVGLRQLYLSDLLLRCVTVTFTVPGGACSHSRISGRTMVTSYTLSLSASTGLLEVERGLEAGFATLKVSIAVDIADCELGYCLTPLIPRVTVLARLVRILRVVHRKGRQRCRCYSATAFSSNDHGNEFSSIGEFIFTCAGDGEYPAVRPRSVTVIVTSIGRRCSPTVTSAIHFLLVCP